MSEAKRAAAEAVPVGEAAIRTIAMPADTNPAGDIFGGWLMAQMDLAAGNVAARLARDHPLVVASVSDPALEQLAAGRGDLESVYRAAAAEQARSERAGVSHALERVGAHVVDAPPERAPQALADAYLALKAAGKL